MTNSRTLSSLFALVSLLSLLALLSLISLQQRCSILDGKTLFSLRLHGAKGMAHSVDTTRGSGLLIFLSSDEHGDRHLAEPVLYVSVKRHA